MIEQKIDFDNENRTYFCKEKNCEFRHVSRIKVYNHIDSKHMNFSYYCPRCDAVCPTRNALMTHGYRTHKMNVL